MTEAQLDPEALRGTIARELTGARQRTALLTDCVDEADLVRQHSPLMSPLVWDLAHIANQEELWLLREVGGREPMHPEIDPLYDAFEHPRAERPSLPLLPPAEARAYAREVRARVLDLIDRSRFGGTRLLSGGFAFGMIAQHEVQHGETMLITHQIRARAGSRAGTPVLAAAAPGPAPADALRLPSEVLVPGGSFTMGTSTEPWALDNERPAHTVDLASFFIDTTPVTCGAYAEFIADGGYDDPRWWTAAGWEYRQRAGLTAPLYWSRDAGQWTRPVFGATEAVRPEEPVLHVCWYEADAYARWAGRRLPTEAEWEKAARFDPETGRSRRYPWGNSEPDSTLANLGQQLLRPAPAGSYPDGAAPCGARQLIGDVWEWTSSDFLPYPGFSAWPYREYSEVFFGPEYKVLRGGSFAVSPVACRGTFRNWDYPIRRQIFSGFRTARSAVLSPGGPSPRTGDCPSPRPPWAPGPPLAGHRLMCRHLAYLGPQATLRSVIIDPPHGLYRQAWAPRRQRYGTVNADGFGVGWFAAGEENPVRYRRAEPIWGDESFADVARVTRSGALLAAVRCATASTGTDLVKAPATLMAAYDDCSGITAAFNKNVLAVLNAELGADFDLDEFEHVAVWDAEAEWIEMRLRSLGDQAVHMPASGLTVSFATGEEMRTEISAKFRRSGVESELAAAGFTMRSWWTDFDGQFGLSLSAPG